MFIKFVSSPLKCSPAPSESIEIAINAAYFFCHSDATKNCLINGVKIGSKNLTVKSSPNLSKVSYAYEDGSFLDNVVSVMSLHHSYSFIFSISESIYIKKGTVSVLNKFDALTSDGCFYAKIPIQFNATFLFSIVMHISSHNMLLIITFSFT